MSVAQADQGPSVPGQGEDASRAQCLRDVCRGPVCVPDPVPGSGLGELCVQRGWGGRRARDRGENLSALTGSGGGCSKRLRLAVEAASGSALT